MDIKDLEKTLWTAADKMRSNMDAAEYKHVVLGLIFLKYISDAFNSLHDNLLRGKGEYEGANAENRTNTWHKTYSLFLKKHAGSFCRIKPNNPR
jgi:type I restriction-modification system DNA methylase subunit